MPQSLCNVSIKPGTEQMLNKCLMNESLLKNKDLTQTDAITIIIKCAQVYAALHSLKNTLNNSMKTNLITWIKMDQLLERHDLPKLIQEETL